MHSLQSAVFTCWLFTRYISSSDLYMYIKHYQPNPFTDPMICPQLSTGGVLGVLANLGAMPTFDIELAGFL